MSENKNPLQCDSTVAGRQEKSRDNKSLLAYYNPKPGIMSSFLMHGQRNAISRRELESLTGWSGRMVRLMIEKERRAGAPILSDKSCGGNSKNRPGGGGGWWQLSVKRKTRYMVENVLPSAGSNRKRLR